MDQKSSRLISEKIYLRLQAHCTCPLLLSLLPHWKMWLGSSFVQLFCNLREIHGHRAPPVKSNDSPHC